jgi:hypothetical protein
MYGLEMVVAGMKTIEHHITTPPPLSFSTPEYLQVDKTKPFLGCLRFQN